MIDIFCQTKKQCLIPDGPGADKIKEEYIENQMVRCKVTLVSEALKPSIEQNNLLHKCFELVSENGDKFESKDSAKFRCKVGIDFRHKDRVAVTPGGKVVCEYRSFSFGSLHGKERLTVMDKAFVWCANDIGLTVDEMVAEAKERMGKSGAW